MQQSFSATVLKCNKSKMRNFGQSCKNVRTVQTSRCYFFWPVLIFGKSTQKTGKNTRKQAKNSVFLVLIFLWEKLVGAYYKKNMYICESRHLAVVREQIFYKLEFVSCMCLVQIIYLLHIGSYICGKITCIC